MAKTEQEIKIRNDEVDPSPPGRHRSAKRDHAPGGESRNERENRREHEQRLVHAGGHCLFLHEVLQPIGGGLQPSLADTIRAVSILDPGGDLSLGERQESDAHHVDREDDHHFHDREYEKRHSTYGRQIRIGRLKKE